MSETHLFRFSSVVLAIPVAIAAALVVLAGFLAWQRVHPAAWLAALGAALFPGAFIAPMLFQDRVVVTPQAIEQTTGFWWAPTIKGFRYADVASVKLMTIVDSDGLSENVWELRGKDGSKRVIDPGDLWETNEEAIVPLLRGFGVTIESTR